MNQLRSTEHTPKLFSEDLNQEETDLSNEKENENNDQLFDQDTNEEEDFEIPAFFKKTKVLMIQLEINENSNKSTGTFAFSSDAE